MSPENHNRHTTPQTPEALLTGQIAKILDVYDLANDAALTLAPIKSSSGGLPSLEAYIKRTDDNTYEITLRHPGATEPTTIYLDTRQPKAPTAYTFYDTAGIEDGLRAPAGPSALNEIHRALRHRAEQSVGEVAVVSAETTPPV